MSTFPLLRAIDYFALNEDDKKAIEERMLDWARPDLLADLDDQKQAPWLHARFAFEGGEVFIDSAAYHDPLFFILKVLSGTETGKVKEVFGDIFEEARKKAAALEKWTGFKTLREYKTRCESRGFDGREEWRDFLLNVSDGAWEDLSGFQRFAAKLYKREMKRLEHYERKYGQLTR